MRRRLAVGIGAGALVCALAVAQVGLAQQSGAEMSPGLLMMSKRMTPGVELNRYLEQLRNDFWQLDANIDGKLSRADIALHEAMEAQRLRASAAQRMMRYDMDGDGVVTVNEVRAAMRYDQRTYLGEGNPRGASSRDSFEAQIDGELKTFAEQDADRDGKLTYVEASRNAGQPRMQAYAEESLSGKIERALTLATATKGEITLQGFVSAGQALFRQVDSDASDKLSQDELVKFWQGPEAPSAAAQAGGGDKVIVTTGRPNVPVEDPAATVNNGCAMPKASAKAKIVLLSVYDTDALSSTTIGTQDAVVHAGKINVEPGSEPLYVVVAGYAATIWQFTGATQRIERVVLSSGQTEANGSTPGSPPLAGATGIDRDKVSFFARANCLRYFSEAPSSQSVQTMSFVREQLGREPDTVAAQYAVTSFSVPSGKFEVIKDRNAGKLVIQNNTGGPIQFTGDMTNVIVQSGPSDARDNLYRFSPGGVISINPASVVASRPAMAYTVLPQEAGLVQLLASGALTQNKSREYIVRKPMRFPPGLHGAHLVTFVVPKGAPVPEGDPGHSCVVVEDPAPNRFRACR